MAATAKHVSLVLAVCTTFWIGAVDLRHYNGVGGVEKLGRSLPARQARVQRVVSDGYSVAFAFVLFEADFVERFVEPRSFVRAPLHMVKTGQRRDWLALSGHPPLSPAALTIAVTRVVFYNRFPVAIAECKIPGEFWHLRAYGW